MSDVSVSRDRRRSVLLCLLVTLGVLLFQHFSGVWSSDLGGDPDEPAHAVTSLMVRDYLATALGQSPMAFAQQYYEDLPKVALGHYPPGYYALTGLALLVWPQPVTLFVVQALLAGLLAALVHGYGRRFLAPRPALTAALLTVVLPVSLKLTQLVMADLLLACLCLLALEAWARFLESPRARWALAFGFCAALAILTKGSGLALALVPALTVPLLRRWELLKSWRFWLAGVPVGLLAGPWMLYSSKITREGMVNEGVVKYALDGLGFYARAAEWSFGWPLLALFLAGLALGLVRTLRRRAADPRIAGLFGLLAGTAAVMLLVPTGYSSRYFMPVVPGIALLAALVAARLPPRVQPWGLALLLAAGLVQAAGVSPKIVQGYGAAVAQALGEPAAAPRQWLVSSDPRGEGAIIAAAAFAGDRHEAVRLDVIRASKELGSSDWLGRGYRPAFATTAELRAFLEQNRVSCVFVDLSGAGTWQQPHDRLLRQALQEAPAQWRRLRGQPLQRSKNEAGELEIYQRLPQP